ncbi:MAG: hypothetical protein EBU09_07435 [Betaproteobacteria bacterium]|nr:hypothetical protein [Betaproteobacteria bacterium]
MKHGVYVGEVDSDGFDESIHIQARVEVSDRGIHVDYSGSSAQVRYGINETYNHSYAYTIFPLKCLLAPSIPNNDGFTRLITVHAPLGSIVNARFPAAVGARHLIGHQLQAAIFQALAPVFPSKVQADSGTPLWSVLLRGLEQASGKGFSSILFFNGGMGAMQDRDDPDSLWRKAACRWLRRCGPFARRRRPGRKLSIALARFDAGFPAHRANPRSGARLVWRTGRQNRRSQPEWRRCGKSQTRDRDQAK